MKIQFGHTIIARQMASSPKLYFPAVFQNAPYVGYMTLPTQSQNPKLLIDSLFKQRQPFVYLPQNYGTEQMLDLMTRSGQLLDAAAVKREPS